MTDLSELPTICQVDGCDNYVDRDLRQLSFRAENWSLMIWLWLCPRDMGIMVAETPEEYRNMDGA